MSDMTPYDRPAPKTVKNAPITRFLYEEGKKHLVKLEVREKIHTLFPAPSRVVSPTL